MRPRAAAGTHGGSTTRIVAAARREAEDVQIPQPQPQRERGVRRDEVPRSSSHGKLVELTGIEPVTSRVRF
jgi:hypothetical protein